MSISLGSTVLSPPVFLAPLAGVTDLPFRNLVSRFGAGLVVSEMVASQEMVQNKPAARERAELGFGVQNTSVQIAGRDAYWMAEAAKLIADNGAGIIDINMGCPAKKVTSGYSGSALMRDLDHAVSLVDAVVTAVDIPVTLKMRLGWDNDTQNAPELARRAEQAGVRMVTVHGRTRCQFYKGSANWSAISQVKQAVTIPVIANGDIINSQTARQAMQASGADGVMVGRGAQGRPWVLAQIAHDLFDTPAPSIPQGTDLVDMVSQHYSDMISFYGRDFGQRVARKHLGWYMDDAQTPKALRTEILTQSDPDVVLSQIQSALTERYAA